MFPNAFIDARIVILRAFFRPKIRRGGSHEAFQQRAHDYVAGLSEPPSRQPSRQSPCVGVPPCNVFGQGVVLLEVGLMRFRVFWTAFWVVAGVFGQGAVLLLVYHTMSRALFPNSTHTQNDRNGSLTGLAILVPVLRFLAVDEVGCIRGAPRRSYPVQKGESSQRISFWTFLNAI